MKIDYIHFYVEDAKSSCEWFVNHLGFQCIASGTSCHNCTKVLKNGSVYIILTSPITSSSPAAQFLRLHPPGVADIAFVVSDLEGVMEQAVAHGAKVLQPLEQKHLEQGGWKWGQIAGWGSVSHTLSEYRGKASFLSVLAQQGVIFENVSPSEPLVETLAFSRLFTGIDHVVLNVAAGGLEQALRWYEAVLGFQRQQTYTIETQHSGLRSQVMVHPESGVHFPINEPTSANSQIQEFLDVNKGPGIQHIALRTPKIVDAIAQLKALNLPFLPIPPSYYTQLRLSHPHLPISALEFQQIAEQEILVDWQESSPQSLLLQTFTQPIFKQPTFFFELIERRQQAKGFGEGNFRALFEAIEREQLKRGSLEIYEDVE